MSHHGLVSLLSLVLLAGLAPAQEKTRMVEQLRKENAELRKQNATLKQRLAALEAKAKAEKEERSKKDDLAKARMEKARLVRKMRELDAKAAAALRAAVRRPRVRGVWLDDVTVARITKVGSSAPIPDKDFQEALKALAAAARKLGQQKDPTMARSMVDDMERILGQARRALWKLEQKAKEKAKGKAKGKEKEQRRQAGKPIKK